jgi:hypothetical protein
MDHEEAPNRSSKGQRAAFAASRADRDSTLIAIHRLEAATAMAAPGREADWLEQVITDLRSLEEAVTTERNESLQPDSLLSMIARDYPRRFSSRVRQVRQQHDDISRTIASLRGQLEVPQEGAIDFTDLRQRLGLLLGAIRYRWARETDLVYEAISLDLGSGPERPAATS